MEITEIIGFIGALLIGMVLGLIGGGGSILTVPVLVYIFSIQPVVATAYSLFVVGTSSLTGTLKNYHKGLIRFRTAVSFAIPTLLAVFVTRRFLFPSIPDLVFKDAGIIVEKNQAVMILFALLMLGSGLSMTLNRNQLISTEATSGPNYMLLIPLGLFTGLITGLVGAGGGFIIIPILVLLAGLPMKQAVGTSLSIVAASSLIGFLGDLGHQNIHWKFLLSFSAVAICGIFIGIYLHKYVGGKKLEKSFGWFVLLMGFYILFKEIKL